MAKPSSKKSDSSANIGFEAKLWLAADKLRNNMDAAEYKHVVLGLIFLKYISDSFDEQHAKLIEGKGELDGANPEDKDEYLAANVFWVPKEARWAHLQSRAKQPGIGRRGRRHGRVGARQPAPQGCAQQKLRSRRSRQTPPR